jgi:hypothetical protein
MQKTKIIKEKPTAYHAGDHRKSLSFRYNDSPSNKKNGKTKTALLVEPIDGSPYTLAIDGHTSQIQKSIDGKGNPVYYTLEGEHGTPPTAMHKRGLLTTGTNTKVSTLSPQPESDPSLSENLNGDNTCRSLLDDFDDPKPTVVSNQQEFICNKTPPKKAPTKRSKSQQQVMGISAKQAIAKTHKPLKKSQKTNNKKRTKEWLHLIAHMFINEKPGKSNKHKLSFKPQSKDNLVAATDYANTSMLNIELAAKKLLRSSFTSNCSFLLHTSASILPNSTNVAKEINQNLTFMQDGQKIASVEQTISAYLGDKANDAKQRPKTRDELHTHTFLRYYFAEKLSNKNSIPANLSPPLQKSTRV